MRIWIRPSIFSLQICGFCDLRTSTPHKFANFLLRNEPKNFQILDLGTNKKKFPVPPVVVIWKICAQYHNYKNPNIYNFNPLAGTFIFVIYKLDSWLMINKEAGQWVVMSEKSLLLLLSLQLLVSLLSRCLQFNLDLCWPLLIYFCF